jgi:Kdo2-lipid IVA lauroyltransferase/acyltransferase
MRPEFNSKMLLPKYWLTWLGFGVWWLLAQLPFRLQMLMGKYFGKLMAIFAKRRIAIARRNLELCFPHLSSVQQKDLLNKHIDSLGKVFFETGLAWFASQKRLRKLVTTEGLEHLQTAQQENIGVILMAMHFTHLDLGAAFVNLQHSIDGSYRQHDNPVYDWVQHRCRERCNTDTTAIEVSDIRTVTKQLRRGRAIWYAPDQDYRKRDKHNIFLPFFGVEAACITSTSQLARMGKARVIPFVCIRHQQGYRLQIYPPLADFPTEDIVADTTRIMKIVEDAILLAPEQYLWVHRRFKTRPEGQPSLYSNIPRKRKRKVN